MLTSQNPGAIAVASGTTSAKCKSPFQLVDRHDARAINSPPSPVAVLLVNVVPAIAIVPSTENMAPGFVPKGMTDHMNLSGEALDTMLERSRTLWKACVQHVSLCIESTAGRFFYC